MQTLIQEQYTFGSLPSTLKYLMLKSFTAVTKIKKL